MTDWEKRKAELNRGVSFEKVKMQMFRGKNENGS